MNTTRSRSEQLWPIAGLVLAVGNVIIGMAAGSAPASDSPIDELRQSLSDHRGAILAFGAWGVVSLPLGLWFVSGLVRRARGSSAGAGLAANVALGVTVATSVELAIVNLLASGALVRDGQLATFDDSTVRLLWMTSSVLFMGGVALGGGIIISASIAQHLSSSAPRWLTIGGIVAGFAMVIGAVVGVLNADAMDKWNLLIGLLSLWVLVTAITHLVRGRKEVTA